VKRLPVAIVGGLLALSTIFALTQGEPAAPGALGALGAPSASPGTGGVAVVPGAASATPVAPDPDVAAPDDPAPDDPAPADPTPAPEVDVALVPVTHFRTTKTTVDLDDVAATLAGSSKRFDALELVAGDADAILAALGLEAPADADQLILAPDAATLAADLAKHRTRLGFLRAEEISPAVRALAWGKVNLFGTDRVRTLGDWPIVARLLAAPDGAAPFDPGATWTLFAAGDIMLDRGVYETVRVKGKGVDFPFDGGTADITGRTCCSSFGWEVPRTKRTGNAGAVRDLIEGADVAMANFENPAPDRFRWHTSGTVFSADPGIIDGLAAAGFDHVGIANNHIGDAGKTGIAQTIANLTERGLVTSGAGKNEAAARKPAMIEVDGTTVAILAYDRIARYYFATSDTSGSAPLSVKRVANDIKKARANGADVVVVFPHWGVEYTANPSAGQQRTARDIIDAGADMIIGNHAHWAAALEIYQGKPIWYALGNFVFDQTWSEPTMEGITLELTFHGDELAQIRMRPHIILDKAQPNFLDPAGDGKVVMDQVFGASKGLLPW
jgi:hypothetical protein